MVWEERKAFFFEKKNQKTFATWLRLFGLGSAARRVGFGDDCARRFIMPLL